MTHPARLAAYGLALTPLALMGLAPAAQAAGAGDAGGSEIRQVLVYPGGATVERVAKVPAGARELVLNCLSARFDTDSLQVQGSDGLRLGEVSVQTLDRARLPECANSPLETRVRELEAQKAALQAESDAHGLALGYLKALGGEGRAAAPAPASINATADTVRRTGLDALQRQQQLAQRLAELERQLQPLRAERDQQIGQNPQLRRVTVRLATAAEAELRLSYRLRQAGWTPVYRAELDTARGQLRLERQAQVAQQSGEDWRGVSLRLATNQPQQAAGLPPPQPWTVAIRPPQADFAPKDAEMRARAPAMLAAMPAAAPAPEEALPNFDVSVFQGAYDAEFVVPGTVSLGGDGQAVNLQLGSTPLPAQVFSRVQPQQSAQAWLVAETARPAGSWPRGRLQLFRDGRYVGQTQLSLGGEPVLTLPFGADELVRVQVAPPQRDGATTGLISSRQEQRLTHVYTVENRHTGPVQLQLIEPAPVAQHEDLKLTRRFEPAPTQTDWRDLPGVALWQLPLAAGQTVTLRADYSLSAPKDAAVSGWR